MTRHDDPPAGAAPVTALIAAVRRHAAELERIAASASDDFGQAATRNNAAEWRRLADAAEAAIADERGADDQQSMMLDDARVPSASRP